jgi:hypothetical protein
MRVSDDDWERYVASREQMFRFSRDVANDCRIPSLKASGEQVDDRIVEVCWDPLGEHWRMIRFRDDKPQGNHRSVVENVIQSIADGVEKDMVGATALGVATSAR